MGGEMGKNIRIAQLLPDIPNLGGLATRTFEQSHVFNFIKGVESDFFKITKKLKNDFEPKKISIENTQYGLSLRQYEVSYNSKVIKESIKKLNEYDLLWFNHACPHTNTEGEKDAELWMELYRSTKPKKLVVISDVYFNKYYPWFLNVADSVTSLLGIGHGHAASVDPYLKIDGILKHPFLFQRHEFSLDEKREGIIWASQWRAWKGIVEYLKMCPYLNESTTFYGAGMEYYMIRKENPKLFEKAIGKDFFSNKLWNEESKNNIMGTAPSSEVLKSYITAKAAVDFTCIDGSKKYRGHYNRTTLEPMLYKSMIICPKFLVEPYTHIPKDCVLVVDKGTEHMASLINDALEDKKYLRTVTKRAYEWIKENHRGESILKEWIDYTLNKKENLKVSHVYKNGVIANKGKWW